VLSRCLLAVLWVGLGLTKMAAPTGFVSHIEALTSAPYGSVLAWAMIVGEAALGLAILVLAWRSSPVCVRVCAFSAVLAIVLLALAAFGSPDASNCGCFGAVVQATRSRRIVVAACLLFLSAQSFGSVTSHREDARVAGDQERG